MVGEGEVFYIFLCYFKYGFLGERKSWDEIIDDVKIDIEVDLWGSGLEVEIEEVECLMCCCCECCYCFLF